MRAAGLGRGDACVTNRCPPARVDMQCRLPLLVEGVALAGDQAWLSPEADGDWRVEFRCRCPRTTMAHDDDLGCPPRRGLPHPVPAGTTVHLPARVRITLVRETKHQLCVRGPIPAVFVRSESETGDEEGNCSRRRSRRLVLRLAKCGTDRADGAETAFVPGARTETLVGPASREQGWRRS